MEKLGCGEGSRERRPAEELLSFSIRSPSFLQEPVGGLSNRNADPAGTGMGMGAALACSACRQEAGAGLSQRLSERETGQHLVKGLDLNLMH